MTTQKGPFLHSIFSIRCISAITSALLAFTQLPAQTDIEQIIEVRNASNDALRSLDNELSYTFMTEDMMITTGAGTLLNGKEALRKYVGNLEGGEMYWVRSADEIQVNAEKGLAWESGTWKGYNVNQSTKVINRGNYSAMWTKSSGEWLIKSQLFVTLD